MDGEQHHSNRDSISCTTCGVESAPDHKAGCQLVSKMRRRTHESWAFVVNGQVLALAADFDPRGWRGSWSALGHDSREALIGGGKAMTRTGRPRLAVRCAHPHCKRLALGAYRGRRRTCRRHRGRA